MIRLMGVFGVLLVLIGVSLTETQGLVLLDEPNPNFWDSSEESDLNPEAQEILAILCDNYFLTIDDQNVDCSRIRFGAKDDLLVDDDDHVIRKRSADNNDLEEGSGAEKNQSEISVHKEAPVDEARSEVALQNPVQNNNSSDVQQETKNIQQDDAVQVNLKSAAANASEQSIPEESKEEPAESAGANQQPSESDNTGDKESAVVDEQLGEKGLDTGNASKIETKEADSQGLSKDALPAAVNIKAQLPNVNASIPQPENADVQSKNAEAQPKNAEVQQENSEAQPQNSDVQSQNAEAQPERAEPQPEKAENVTSSGGNSRVETGLDTDNANANKTENNEGKKQEAAVLVAAKSEPQPDKTPVVNGTENEGANNESFASLAPASTSASTAGSDVSTTDHEIPRSETTIAPPAQYSQSVSTSTSTSTASPTRVQQNEDLDEDGFSRAATQKPLPSGSAELETTTQRPKESEAVDDQQSGNAILLKEPKSLAPVAVEGSDSDAQLAKIATKANIKSAEPEQPNTGESAKNVSRAGKDTTILIVLFVVVIVIGAAAFTHNFIKKRKQKNAENSDVVNGIRRSLQNLTSGNGKNSGDVEQGTEMKPLMKANNSPTLVKEYSDSKKEAEA